MYAIPSAITMGNAAASLVELRRAIDGGETQVSLAALERADGAAPVRSDSSALAVLLAAVRHGRLAGRTIHVSGMPAAVRSLAKLYGVDDMIGSDGGLLARPPA